MRAVVQRVTQAQVVVSGEIAGAIETGLLVLLGVTLDDTEKDSEYLARKILGLRIFNDNAGRMNRSVQDAGGSILVVSQFTLYGDIRRGMRPSFDQAARPEQARHLYEHFVALIRESGIQTETGVFQAEMQVTLTNEGPVTLICESVRLTSTE